MHRDKNSTNAYLVGGGIASLAAAAYLIRDGGVPGENITIFDEGDVMGGSLDAVGLSPEGWYTMRGFRMFEEKVYSSTLDLMSFIPSLENGNATLRDDFIEFNKEVKTNAKARLIENRNIIDPKPLQLGLKDRIGLLKFLVMPEKSLGSKRIDEYFTPSFFESDFWYEYATTFSFLPWHSVAEFRRYILRFLQDAPVLDTAECIRSTRYNQFDSIVRPVVRWLQEQNVRFRGHCVISDIEILQKGKQKVVKNITCREKKGETTIPVNEEDIVIVTLGSMSANSTLGTMETAPHYERTQSHASWDLWEKIARNNPEFGNPKAFCSQPDKSQWTSFTLTCHDPLFFRLMEEFTGNTPGTDGLVTIKDSNWLLTIGLPHQPHFVDQAQGVTVCWGYGLYPDRNGNFIEKKMSACTGNEILTELCTHLGFDEHLDAIRGHAACIPCMMPYITSQFFPRHPGDRPPVVPKNAENFAFTGQYCEIPKDMVFTVEYSIRSAQIAVHSLLGMKKKSTRMYHGRLHPMVILNSIRTAFR